MRVLVVNADDFGLTPGVNLGILEGIKKGIVTSASLMVNGPAVTHGLELAREHPEIDLGIHLNATDFSPILPADKVSALCNGTGRFRGLRYLLAVTFASHRARLQLAAEWREQVSWALSTGLSPSHVDSHHHVHMAPWLFDVAASLAEEFRLPFVRVSDEVRTLRASPALQGLLTVSYPYGYRIKRRLLSTAAWLDRTRHPGVRSADFFVDTYLPKGPMPIQKLQALVSALPPGVTELICHPSLPDEYLASVTSYTSGRYREFEQLTRPGLRSFLQRAGVSLSSFRELAQQ
jgi:hypothetical protein